MGKIRKMKKITIRTPIWKYKAVGIVEYKVDDDFEIKISYKTKSGELLYPNTYFMTKDQIKKFPIKYMGGMFIYLIPIERLKTKQ